MRIHFIVFLLPVFLCPVIAKAQIPYIDSREVILKGEAQYDSGNYKKAMEYYRQVNECDTNYSVAVYDIINSLIADSSYELAGRYAMLGTKLSGADKRSFLLQLGSAYDYNNKPDSALFIYNSLISQYPNDHQPWHEIGVAYFLKKNYDLAAYYFQKAIMINPYHFRSHYMLGRVYAVQGRLAEAMMALETSLLLTQSAEQAKLSIGIISSISEETDEMNKMYSEKNEKYSNPVYDEIDQIVNAKLAFEKEYKLKISINDNIFRQSQVIMEKLRFVPTDTTFSMQFYVPLLTEIYQKDLFEGYMLLLYSNFGLESVDNLAKKKKQDVAAAKEIAFPYLTHIQSTRELNYNKRKDAEEKYHYFPSDDFYLIGKISGTGNNAIPQGDLTLYRTNHSLLAVGNNSDIGQKQGVWKFYYGNGQLKTLEKYKDNVAIDTTTEYYSNGNLKKITIMDNAGTVNEERDYTYKGTLSKVTKKTGEDEYEETTYFSNGQVQLTLPYNKKLVKDGVYNSYYKNGRIEKVIPIKDGKYAGPGKKYYENGKLSEECNYEDDQAEGVDTKYYETGKVKSTYTFHKGKYEGDFKEYYDNGVLAETGSYRKGKKTGTDIRYNRKGQKYGEIEINDDVPVSIKCYDANNKEFYTRANKDGLRIYSLFYSNGNKYIDIKLSEDGFMEGLTPYYSYTGSKDYDINYKNGNKEGKYTSYFKDGRKQVEEAFKDDKADGYYKSYYQNGTVQQEGWYKDGDKQGVWKTYYVNGKMDMELYYLDDYNNGYRKIYNVNGEIIYKDLYDYNILVATVVYDKDGNVYDSSVYPRGNGHYRMPFKNGKISFESELKNGELDGAFTKRFSDGSVCESGHFKEGNKEGTCTEYYPGGAKKSEGLYEAGNKEGKWLYYNEAGELTDEENYIKGVLEGPRKFFAANTLRILYNYVDGEKDSAQIYYGEDNKIACALFYQGGDLEGYTYEGTDGKLLPQIPVKNGTVKIAAVYSNGQKAAEFNIVEDIFTDKQKIYFSNGKLAEERNYSGRDLDGPFVRYNPDGKICYEATYKSDELCGTEKTYDKNGAMEISKEYYYGSPNGITTVTDPNTKKTKTFTYHYGDLIKTGE